MKRLNDLSRAHFTYEKHLFLNISLFCNKNCSYCYLDSDSRKNKYTIPINKIDEYLNQFKQNEIIIKYITLVGGEPALLKNFNQITKHLSDNGYNLLIHTNGMISKNQIEHLSNLNVTYLSFSLDSFNSELNDIQRFKGATVQTLKKISIAKLLNLPTRVSIVITKKNIDNFEDYVKMAQEYNIDLINIHRLEIKEHQPEWIKDSYIEPNDWVNYFNQWMEIAKSYNVLIRAPISFLPEKYINEINQKGISCIAKTWDSFNLLPTGKVYRCPMLIDSNNYLADLNNNNCDFKFEQHDNSIFEGNTSGMCPILVKENKNNGKNLFPVCPFIKTTLNPKGGVENQGWDQIIFDFINQNNH